MSKLALKSNNVSKLSTFIGASALLAASALSGPSVASEVKIAATDKHATPVHGSVGGHAKAPAKKSHGAAHWDYKGSEGPGKWGDLSPAYKVCGQGLAQSPIDLHSAVNSELSNIVVSYQATPYEVVNNGHTIQVNVQPGSNIMLEGESYKLLQFHFHHPSEHLKDGKPFEMEAHFVHISDKGVLAVLGVFIKPGSLCFHRP